MKSPFLLCVALIFALTLTGCAVPQPTYDDKASRALNIAKAANLWKAQDYAASTASTDNVGAVLDITTSALSFNSSLGLDMAMGNAVGLSLLSFAFSPPSQLDRNAVLAWVPETQAADEGQAALVLSKAIMAAAEATLREEGIAFTVEKAHEERLALFYPYLDSSLAFSLDGKKCGLNFHVYKTQISEARPMPTFIGDGAVGYRFRASDEVQYPSFDIGCYEDGPLPTMELARKISQALPETVFIYIASQRRPEGGRTAPMVLDHGKVLLFLKPAKKE